MDLHRKARFVGNGSSSDPPTHLTYASVVSRDSVRIMFLVAELNGLDVWAGEITNAFIRAPTTVQCEKEFGPEYFNHVGIVIREIYGLQTAAASFQQHLSDCM